MALTRALGSALTGLNAQSFKLDVIGDNIANATTTGFKASRVEFKSMFSQTLRFGSGPQGSLGGVNPLQVGFGTMIATSTKDLTQGELQSTGIRGDIALDGNGFFIMNDGKGGQVFTRDGAFSLNLQNQLFDPGTGLIVQGVNADANFSIPASGPLSNITIPVNDLQLAKATENITFEGNLNSGGPAALMGSSLISAELVDLSLVGTPPANAGTLLTDLGRVTPNGDLDLQIDTADVITINATKGGRTLPEQRFYVGTSLQAGFDGFGTTLGELTAFMNRALGINNTGANQYGAIRDNDTNPNTVGVSAAATTVVTTVGSASVHVDGTNFIAEGVQLGDVLRFNTGNGTGQLVTVTGFATTGATINDTMLVTDFTPNVPFPTAADLFTVHEPSGVSVVDFGVAADTRTWLPDGTIHIAGNVGEANHIANIKLTNVSDAIPIGLFAQIEEATGESIISNATIYDSIGNPHNVEFTYVLETKGQVDPQSGNVANVWRVFSEAIDSKFISTTTGGVEGTDRRVGTGQISLGIDGQFLSQSVPAQATFVQLELPNSGAVTPQIISPDFSGMTGFADVVSSPFMQFQDGFETGTLVDYSIEQDGTVQGIFNNGVLRPLARVQLARFTNADGLEHLGESLFQVGANSGQAIIGIAGNNGFGSIVGGALEGSNVDFAKEFTDLIVAQRAFTANARVITRADEMLDNLIAIV